MKNFKKIISVLLIIAMIMCLAACGKKASPEPDNPNGNPATTAEVIVGTGNTQFDLTVTLQDGSKTKYVVKTDKTIVGDALLDAGLIEGEAGPYGLYVKKVAGVEADYDKDKIYWAFYIDGAYASTGVDMTEIEAGKAYAFKIEK